MQRDTLVLVDNPKVATLRFNKWTLGLLLDALLQKRCPRQHILFS